MTVQPRGGAAGRVWALVRGALWPIPTLALLVALGLGIALPALDAALEGPDGHPLTFVFGGGPSAARDLLAAIAGSLISVTGLVFSLTVVALQLASSQYSPRLLQTFATDRFVQTTLAQLTATFVYALTVLRTVRTESATEGEDAFVPRLAITIGYVLALGSVLAIVLFLGHLARTLRVETMLRDVHEEAREVLARELPLDADDGTPPAGVAFPVGDPDRVVAGTSGFVTDVDEQRLIAAAAEADAVVLLVPRIGDSVVTGVPLAHVWRRNGSSSDRESGSNLAATVRATVQLRYERSVGRDVTYSLRKIIDIALRAISPGINDPTTAVHALSHASALLGDLLEHPPQPRCLQDEDGALRLVIPNWAAGELVDLAFEEPLQFASGQPAVLRRIAGMLRELAWRAPGGLVDAEVRARLDEVSGLAESTTSVRDEEIQRWRDDVEAALAGRWPARPPQGGASPQPGATDR